MNQSANQIDLMQLGMAMLRVVISDQYILR